MRGGPGLTSGRAGTQAHPRVGCGATGRQAGAGDRRRNAAVGLAWHVESIVYGLRVIAQGYAAVTASAFGSTRYPLEPGTAI